MTRPPAQWKDGDTLFLRCSAWRELADHAAETLTKGTRVIVTGRLKQRSYETPEGDKRTVYELDADDVGPSLKWATAKIARTSRDKAPHPAGDGDPWQAEPARRRGATGRPAPVLTRTAFPRAARSPGAALGRFPPMAPATALERS